MFATLWEHLVGSMIIEVGEPPLKFKVLGALRVPVPIDIQSVGLVQSGTSPLFNPGFEL